MIEAIFLVTGIFFTGESARYFKDGRSGLGTYYLFACFLMWTLFLFHFMENLGVVVVR